MSPQLKRIQKNKLQKLNTRSLRPNREAQWRRLRIEWLGTVGHASTISCLEWGWTKTTIRANARDDSLRTSCSWVETVGAPKDGLDCNTEERTSHLREKQNRPKKLIYLAGAIGIEIESKKNGSTRNLFKMAGKRVKQTSKGSGEV